MMFPAVALDKVKLQILDRTAQLADRTEFRKQKRSERMSTLRARKFRHTD